MLLRMTKRTMALNESYVDIVRNYFFCRETICFPDDDKEWRKKKKRESEIKANANPEFYFKCPSLCVRSCL